MRVEPLTSADGASFHELFAIYAASITPREQKPEAWLRAMIAASEYRVFIARDAGGVIGFSILFVPPGEGFALLEYMAVAIERRGGGVGAALFRRTVEEATTRGGGALPVVIEVDSDGETSTDQAMRARRLHFYRRLGCAKIVGLRYLMPLEGAGAAPEMVLMIHRDARDVAPTTPVARGDLERWLKTIYHHVYHVSPDDPRIATMLRPLPDPVEVE